MANSSGIDPHILKLGRGQIHVPAALPNKQEAGWAPEAVWTRISPCPQPKFEFRIVQVVTLSLPTELPGSTSIHEDKVKLAIRRKRGRNRGMAVHLQDFLRLLLYADGF
jgi:hypothetical protein